MIAEIIRLVTLMIPDKRNILEWELQQLRKLRYELESRENRNIQQFIFNEEDLVEKMSDFLKYPNIDTLESIKDYIMRNEECGACRSMISLAYMEFKYGRVDKSKEIISELINVYKSSS